MVQAVNNKTDMGQTNPDEHMLLDDNKYIADVLYEVKNSKQKDLQQSRLLFKKRMFRETDETITEAQFVNLSYVQVACLLTGRPVGCFSAHFWDMFLKPITRVWLMSLCSHGAFGTLQDMSLLWLVSLDSCCMVALHSS